ncbi:MAG: hypothetical protein ABL999_03190 [Pyrinomonadaceae bacterium]
MNTTIDQISAETVARIREQALDMGLSADEYIISILPDKKAGDGSTKWEDFKSDMDEFAEEPTGSDSYQGTYSRGDIYFDHD